MPQPLKRVTIADLFPAGARIVIPVGYGFSLCNGLSGDFHRATEDLQGTVERVDAASYIIIALDDGRRVYTSNQAAFLLNKDLPG